MAGTSHWWLYQRVWKGSGTSVKGMCIVWAKQKFRYYHQNHIHRSGNNQSLHISSSLQISVELAAISSCSNTDMVVGIHIECMIYSIGMLNIIQNVQLHLHGFVLLVHQCFLCSQESLQKLSRGFNIYPNSVNWLTHCLSVEDKKKIRWYAGLCTSMWGYSFTFW